jgi:hypothetical protein
MGSEAPLHRHNPPSYHDWLPCLVGPPYDIIVMKRIGGKAAEGQKLLLENSIWGLQGLHQSKVYKQRLAFHLSPFTWTAGRHASA